MSANPSLVEVTAAAAPTARTIVVTFPNNRIHGESNPATADPGDPVTWVFDTRRENVTVEFTAFRDISIGGPLTACGPNGPFDSGGLVHGGNRITGTIKTFTPDPAHVHRFYYRALVDGTFQVAWDNPVPGAPEPLFNGGGLDVPGRPPGT